MYFEPEQLYHIFNRGNDKQKIFFTRDNYYYFLEKVKQGLLTHCEILAYCLMPNHFHLLVSTKLKLNNKKFISSIAHLLSSYARGIQIQENITGSLFQKKTRAKCLTLSTDGSMDPDEYYPLICFNYIHQNPFKAGLVKKMSPLTGDHPKGWEEWEFSSFNDYLDLTERTFLRYSIGSIIT